VAERSGGHRYIGGRLRRQLEKQKEHLINDLVARKLFGDIASWIF
jgi:hypothetical protein